MLKLTDDDTGGNSQTLGKLFECRLVALPRLQKLAHLSRRYEHTRRKFMGLPLLIFRARLVRIVNENTSFTMKDDVSKFVEEGVPELIVALITATQLDQCLIRS